MSTPKILVRTSPTPVTIAARAAPASPGGPPVFLFLASIAREVGRRPFPSFLPAELRSLQLEAARYLGLVGWREAHPPAPDARFRASGVTIGDAAQRQRRPGEAQDPRRPIERQARWNPVGRDYKPHTLGTPGRAAPSKKSPDVDVNARAEAHKAEVARRAAELAKDAQAVIDEAATRKSSVGPSESSRPSPAGARAKESRPPLDLPAYAEALAVQSQPAAGKPDYSGYATALGIETPPAHSWEPTDGTP